MQGAGLRVAARLSCEGVACSMGVAWSCGGWGIAVRAWFVSVGAGRGCRAICLGGVAYCMGVVWSCGGRGGPVGVVWLRGGAYLCGALARSLAALPRAWNDPRAGW